ncbi:hypothetical protein FB192DRAFT_1073894 [Mucor lusitanicus]|uniref:J domain-containing protein n=2 Tax=Mucor circinelloides f. lusitanicus TaxID=29924 RepID=A0A168QCH7_MUCCL|nr:hypothetical protein FB192DRAFT_1073894 [Mucor lusitanicus]OAD09046.1 hypothetical protein MUCCIDRAFT_106019 [Mucor lusitanicus CBS 277.49]
MISHISTVVSDEKEDKYSLIEDILSASNYYEALGLPDDSSFDEIRRAYIQKSRICHPDKFVPPYPRATKSFQVLSAAYNTLSQPTKKLTYDTQQRSSAGLDHYTSYCSEDNAVDIFQQVIRQLYIEIMEGEFQTLRTVIHAMNETNRLIHINDELLSIAEVGFLKIRDILTTSQKYYSIIQFELLRLYDLQDELRNLSYFDVWRRLRLSVSMAKLVLRIPLIVNKAFQQQDSMPSTQQQQQRGDLLGYQIECGLEKAISLVESSEEYASLWCNSSDSFIQ